MTYFYAFPNEDLSTLYLTLIISLKPNLKSSYFNYNNILKSCSICWVVLFINKTWTTSWST